METFLQDVTYSLRTLRKHPGFAAVAILTLALGIGVNSVIFSLVNGILLRPLPFPESEKIVSVFTVQKDQAEQDIFSPANFLDLKSGARQFDAVAAYNYFGFDLVGKGEPEALTVIKASTGFFDVLGVNPFLGRAFSAEEDLPGNDRVVLLNYSLWQRLFAGDPQVIGKTILLDGLPYRILGVMPQHFQFPEEVDVWAPLALDDQQRSLRGANFLQVIARLKPEVHFDQAQSEMDGLSQRLEKEYPQYNTGIQIRVASLEEAIVGESRPMLLVLAAAVAFVLLIACANLANLLLANASSRKREFAVRVAMGASKSRMVRQLLTESLVLSLLGGTLGLLLAIWALPLLLKALPENTPRVHEIQLDAIVILFTTGVSLLTGILFGLLPAFSSSRPDLHDTLKEGSGASGISLRGRRFADLLVVGEVALVLVLLIGAGLMIRSLGKLHSVDPGFQPDRLLSLQLFLPGSRYEEPAARRAFCSSVLDRLSAMTEIESAALASSPPFGIIAHGITLGFRIEGQPQLPAVQEPVAYYTRITPAYFETMRIPLTRGRSFAQTDHESAPPVAIVNETMARRFWPGQNPVGQRLIIGTREPVTMEIVGVAGNVKHTHLRNAFRAEIYVPYFQRPSADITFVARTKGDPTQIMGAFKNQLWAVDKDLPAQYLTTMNQLLNGSMSDSRSNAILLAVFASLALLIALVGLYGVIAHSISRRTREMGVRITLGARRGDILRLVLGQGAGLTLIGILVGVLGAIALTRFLSFLLFEVTTTDPLVFVTVPILLLSVALIAAYIPARRAMQVDPTTALRYE